MMMVQLMMKNDSRRIQEQLVCNISLSSPLQKARSVVACGVGSLVRWVHPLFCAFLGAELKKNG